jgi:uncharacterized protein
MKRVFIIHGWDGAPTNAWIPWLKHELESRGYLVQAPAMPHPEHPTIQDWVSDLAVQVGTPDADTFFVGHSIGCQAILRYLETINHPVGGLVCVAGWFRLLHMQSDSEKVIAKPWLETPFNFEKIRQMLPRVIAIFSDNDEDVDLGNKALFETYLDAKTMTEHDKGHFSDDSGVTELPSVLSAVEELAAK